MKYTIKLFALAFAVLFGLASCQQEPAPGKEQPAATHTVEFIAALPSTKTTVDISDGVNAKYAWSESDADPDKFHIWENNVKATSVTATITDGLMHIEATFIGGTVENAEYKAAFNSGVQASQNSGADGYDQASDVLVATAAQKDGNSLMFAFERQVAFAQITLKGLEKGNTVTKVTVEDLDGKAIAAEYDTQTGTFSTESTFSAIEIKCNSEISNGEAVVWLTTIPFEDGNIEITAETVDGEGNTATYTKQLAAPLTLACNDVRIMNVNLIQAIETSTLYMIGNSTKGVWNPDAMTPLQQDASDPYIFTFEGSLSDGELKLYTIAGSACWDMPAIRPVEDKVEIGQADIVDAPFLYSLNPDNKWNVKAGKYHLTFNLRTYKMSSKYLGGYEYDWPEVTPIVTEHMYLIGWATSIGWTIEQAIELTRQSDYIFVYEGYLSQGSFRACTERSYDIAHIRPKVDNMEVGKAGCSSNEFVLVTSPDFNWNVADAGNYRITFDLEHWTVNFEYLN